MENKDSEEEINNNSNSNKNDNGNKYLLGGAALGTFGTTIALSASYVCPVCMIGTPLLLGYGGWQKYKYLKNKNESKSSHITSED